MSTFVNDLVTHCSAVTITNNIVDTSQQEHSDRTTLFYASKYIYKFMYIIVFAVQNTKRTSYCFIFNLLSWKLKIFRRVVCNNGGAVSHLKSAPYLSSRQCYSRLISCLLFKNKYDLQPALFVIQIIS